MNPSVVARLVGNLLVMLVVLLAAPLGLALVDGHQAAVHGYGAALLLTAALAGVLLLFGRHAPAGVHRKDALGAVALVWLLIGWLGAVPFMVEGSIPDAAGAFFESVSGFTTTGATVVSDVSGLSRATNLWRCLMHWVGGMGIVVLFVAVFPQMGVGARKLFNNEAAGPTPEGLRPRITHTALVLWFIYEGLTVACAAILWGFGVGLFDAVCHAMSTLGTGGFSTRSESGLAKVGPTHDFGFVPDAGKYVLSFCMLAGRLEIFVLLAAFSPESWRR